jgi:uncharacterized DUF497 family protein
VEYSWEERKNPANRKKHGIRFRFETASLAAGEFRLSVITRHGIETIITATEKSVTGERQKPRPSRA